MATWPVTLPQKFLVDSYKETDKDLVITFKTEAGPPMTRLRCESNILPFSGNMYMTAAQKAIFRTFWETNCAIPFDFPDPDTGATISVRFVAPADYSPMGLGWKVGLQLAKVP